MGFDIECIIDIHNYPGEYFCPVCRTLVYPNEALQSQCTHLYCKACLAHVSNGDKACPYDGYLVLEAHSKPLIETNKILAETIGKVKVRCLFHKSGCTWEGILSECTSHCPGCAYGNSPVICNRCGVQIVHRQVHEHAQTCAGVYPSQQAVEVNPNSQSGAPATAAAAAAGTDQNKQVAQPNSQASQVQNPQISAAPSLPGQDLNQQTNVNSQAPTAVATPEQWYQQQYQQYYQQYAGYDPYQQSYQQYYPYQQQGVQQYQQHPPHVQGQTQPQVYGQPQLQAQPQSYPQVQPQSSTQSQPQAQVPPQAQVQPHIQPLATQHQNQSQVNQQQLFQPPVQSHAQVPPQSYPPPHGQTPQLYPVQPHPQGLQHMQAHPYQQPSANLHNAQPPMALPQQSPQVQPQVSMHPPQSSQPAAAPIVQPQNPLQPHALTGHQSYPQSQLQMPVRSGASGPFPSAHTQSQVLQQQQPMMRPPHAPIANQQQVTLTSQGQFVSQQSLLPPNAQYNGLPVQSRPPQATQLPVSQQYPQQPFVGAFPSQSQQQGPSVQQQPSYIHPPGPPHMAPQTAQSFHAPVQSQPSVVLGPGMHPQPSQNYFGKAMPPASSGSGAAHPVLAVQHGSNQPPNGHYLNSVNNQLQASIDKKKSVAHEGQVDPTCTKLEHKAKATITSQNSAGKEGSVLGTESFETNAVKLETGMSSEQDTTMEFARSNHTDKGNSNDPAMKQAVKEEHSGNAAELSSGAKSAHTDGLIDRASGRLPGNFYPHTGFEVSSNTSQGFPSSALPFGSAGMGRAPLSGPEGHFASHHTPLNVNESHFGQQHPTNRMEAEMFHNRRMNGIDRGLPYHTEHSHDERLKVSGVDHLGTFPGEPRWPLDQAGPGPFDKGPHGFNYDGNALAPSRFLPPYHPPGAPFNIGGAERELRLSLLNDERRNADFVHRHTDFVGPGHGFGPEHMDRFAPRSPPREYFGNPPRGFLPHGPAGFDDLDGREAHMFPGGSRPFRHPPNPVRNSFHDDGFLPLHRHPRGDMVGEHMVPRHLRGIDPLGRRTLHVGEPAGFGPFSGPGSLPHLPFGESFGGNKPAFPRPGEPGFRSRYSLQGVSNEETFMGDADSFDRTRNRISLSMGWCRICKVDCETMEGLDMHSQTREHQNMAMDMVRSIKEQNKKRQKSNTAVEEEGKIRNAAFEGGANKP
ncbi:unnamed protein product [Cuscuta europaea]|uniref:RING-type domain-containing protein n=1 Tax=Cuscuta europaea TaxID=41803 RepID=A0A9P0YSH2_CUSEU|nr:unnamed protein product [Cuscuta europaea]